MTAISHARSARRPGLVSDLGLIFIAAASAAAILCAPAAEAERLLGAPELVTHRIHDANFERPVLAATIGIPKGWAMSSAINWRQAPGGACDFPVSITWTATAPDGVSFMTGLEPEAWASPGSIAGCRPATYAGLEDYLRDVMRHGVPNAEITAYAATPALLDRDRAKIDQMLPSLNNEAHGAKAWVEGGVLRYTTTIEGVEVDGAMIATALLSSMTPSSIAGRDAAPTTFGAIMAVMVVVAPKGKLDLELARAVWNTAVADSKWAELRDRIAKGELPAPITPEEQCG